MQTAGIARGQDGAAQQHGARSKRAKKGTASQALKSQPWRFRVVSLQHVIAERLGDRFGFRMDLELLVNVPEVK
jgi:hypothetical protein